ncbi:NADPH-dependent F420 reductase [Cupriavidus metallidurans]|uniref:NADPH-dependent F420 reductase n=1 Tax=Cupriavidus metallidurans TaxID=119219 RepID=UPI001CD013A6|nr:NAD(P)-binding domain-containing protein [Cupriavidus metallidurans]UBM08994.1 NAD(P)-binding domain-containing protein [Cupriavidus metallidurans]
MSQTGKGFRSERRGFLIGVASAALGAVALPASAQSLRGKPRSKIGVIGAGHIGGTIGGIWVGVGHPVMFSSRHPEELKPLVEKLGSLAQAGTVDQALAFSNVVLLAVPYGALPELGSQHDWKGKIVLDATNAVAPRDGAIVEEVKANGIGVTTAKYLPGARVVRVFNFTSAGSFARESNRKGPLMAVPMAGNDAGALIIAGRLVRDAGFQPVVVGGLSSADRFAPGGKLFHMEGTEAEFRRAMAQNSAP